MWFNMATNKNKTKLERENQLGEVARRYLARDTQYAIAEALGISAPQVNYDLRVLRNRWAADANGCFNERKSEELARIDRLESEYWDAWFKSLAEFTSTTKHAETDVSGLAKKQKATVKTEKRGGDPRYLVGVQWCIQKRADILGLDAPQQSEVNIVDTTDARDRLRELVERTNIGSVANSATNGVLQQSVNR